MTTQTIFNLFKIPNIILDEESSNSKQKTKLIFIIDCSGSMGDIWSLMSKQFNLLMENIDVNKVEIYTYTFDHKISLVASNTLSENIRSVGGGMTNIYEAMVILDNLIEATNVS